MAHPFGAEAELDHDARLAMAIADMAEAAKGWSIDEFASRTVSLLIHDKGNLNAYKRTIELVLQVHAAALGAAETQYVIWSNEHRCWWGPKRSGYANTLAEAGRYSRDEALAICVDARGGRQFNSNPSEVLIALADAERFWADDKEEWRQARAAREAYDAGLTE